VITPHVSRFPSAAPKTSVLVDDALLTALRRACRIENDPPPWATPRQRLLTTHMVNRICVEMAIRAYLESTARPA